MAQSQASSGLSLMNWWYQPVTEWQKTFQNFFHPESTTTQNQQVFVGVNKEDEQTEKHVLDTAGSYGKQLGKMSNVLDILISKHLADLSPEQKNTVADYKAFMKKVSEALASARGPKASDLTPGYLKRLDTALGDKEQDPEDLNRIVSSLSELVKKYSKTTEGQPKAPKSEVKANGRNFKHTEHAGAASHPGATARPPRK